MHEVQNKIRVLIVDDSKLVRKLLRDLVSSQEDMEVIAEAVDPIEARALLPMKPDVITLDVEMPRMDGLTFLEKLMGLHPTPVVMISSLTETNATVTFRALELGAFDFITKPRLIPGTRTLDNAEEILAKIRGAYAVRDYYFKQRGPIQVKAAHPLEPSVHILAGSGAYPSYKKLLQHLDMQSPAITVMHPMPADFVQPFSQRLQEICPVPVQIITPDQALQRGRVYVVPSDKHYQLHNKDRRIICHRHDANEISPDQWVSAIGVAAGHTATIVILSGAPFQDPSLSAYKFTRNTGCEVYTQTIDECIEPSLIQRMSEVELPVEKFSLDQLAVSVATKKSIPVIVAK